MKAIKLIIIPVFLVTTLAFFPFYGNIAQAEPEADPYLFAGGKVITEPSLPFSGGQGKVYPLAFDATDPGGLVVIVHDIDMSYSRFPLPGPSNGVCPVLWEKAISRGNFGGGVTNQDTVGPLAWPFLGAWVWMSNINYYLFQTFYNPGFTGPHPGYGSNSPYLAIDQCGWHGPNRDDSNYDTFDLKLEFQLQQDGDLRVTPFLRLNATTDPFANPAGVWIPFFDAGDCAINAGCRDIPPATFDFQSLKPFVLVANGSEATGGIEISWASVQVYGILSENGTAGTCRNAGWKMFISPKFTSEDDCLNHFPAANKIAYIPFLSR